MKGGITEGEGEVGRGGKKWREEREEEEDGREEVEVR